MVTPTLRAAGKTVVIAESTTQVGRMQQVPMKASSCLLFPRKEEKAGPVGLRLSRSSCHSILSWVGTQTSAGAGLCLVGTAIVPCFWLPVNTYGLDRGTTRPADLLWDKFKSSPGECNPVGLRLYQKHGEQCQLRRPHLAQWNLLIASHIHRRPGSPLS